MEAIYSTFFTFEEIQELKKILKDSPNLLKKVKQSNAFWASKPGEQVMLTSGPLPAWVDPLPEQLHIGRKIKVIKGFHAGKEGVIAEHWLDGDTCSGSYGKQKYQFDNEYFGSQNNSCGINAEDCEFIETEGN